MVLDQDLQSIQEVRDLISRAKRAQQVYASYTQAQVDQLLYKISEACQEQAEYLAKKAVEETGFGIWQDKMIKNMMGSKITYQSIKDMKTIGMIRELPEEKIVEIAAPVGIIAGLVPSTNPTSTVMYKTLIALKSGNAIVFSPHPNAKNCILRTVEIIRGVLQASDVPVDLVSAVTLTTMEATNTLLRHRDVGLILATGGEAMVRAAYSSGNPAIGVGPGNGPAFIERTAQIPDAVRHIFESKTFDNGTICASEQSIVTEKCIEKQVKKEVQLAGGYFLNEEESKRVGALLLRSNGTMNPRIVGKSAVEIGKMAGISVPEKTRILLSCQETVGRDNPYSREKLCPVLGFYVEENWEDACRRCMQILENEGAGHTMVIHSQDEDIVREFALKKPVSRLLVNTPGALGGVGATTNLSPAFTLGCGSVGGSATSDNITPLHLMNIRRVAYGTKEFSEIRKECRAEGLCEAEKMREDMPMDLKKQICNYVGEELSGDQLELISRRILERLQENHNF